MDSADDASSAEATDGLLHTLLMSAIAFLLLGLAFEGTRHLRVVHLRRVTHKLTQERRVPPIPSARALAWAWETLRVTDDQLLRMVGLDGYMLIRYIKLCIKASLFFSFLGLLVLLPIYHSFAKRTAGRRFLWRDVTISSIENDAEAHLLWFPVAFAYVFSGYFCYLLYHEYRHFNEKRLDYLVHGDPSTPLQTYHTVMVERVPAHLQSGPLLRQFFERLFPGQVFSAELCLDLRELDEVLAQRRTARDRVEKAVATWHASHRRMRIRVTRAEYELLRSEDAPEAAPPPPWLSQPGLCACAADWVELDAIDYYTKLLESLNDTAYQLQKLYVTRSLTLADADAKDEGRELLADRSVSFKRRSGERGDREVSIQDIAREGLEHARKATAMATQDAIKGMLEVTRSIELLTVGASYRTSTTAFVTFSSRVARSAAHQMVLSHRFSNMKLRPAPSPRDVIWCAPRPTAEPADRAPCAGRT